MTEINSDSDTKDHLQYFIQNVRKINELKRKSTTDSCEDSDDFQNIDLQLNKSEMNEIVDRFRSVFSLEKSPIQVLHEIFPGQNKVLKIVDKGSFGLAHDPLHITCIEINKIGTFHGKAKSKQESKQQAATNAIAYFSQFLDSNEKSKKKKNKRGRTKNSSLSRKFAKKSSQENEQVQQFDTLQDSTERTIMGPRIDVLISVEDVESNVNKPMDFENENAQNESREFLQAADKSRTVCDEVLQKWSENINPVNLNKLIEKSISDENAKNTFMQQDLWRYKELAGFVLISDIDNSAEVLSIGTGTKCIAGQNLSLNGDVVNDSHAEILARRGLLHVLYDQLESLLSNNLVDKQEFILEPSDSSGKRFRLKNHLKLHLYITSPPCGDSRVFNFNENCRNNTNGALRCKVEKGQGTVPMPIDYISTWDGILCSSQRCTFMSCSDKIALWNVVGIQGSLLSLFIEPIYIESLVVSNLFSYTHLIRALHGRIDKEKLLPRIENLPNYRINECKVGFHEKSSASKDLMVAFIPPYSHNWHLKKSFNDGGEFDVIEQLEIIRTETGVNYLNNGISRLCKRKLLDRFINLITKHPKICDEIILNTDMSESKVLSIENCIGMDYHCLKHIAKNYHQAKIALFQTFKDSDLHTWVPAPIDTDRFPIIDASKNDKKDSDKS
uniref:Double-stranded RNA-specific editase 1-like isoform X2 n=1 Tax=Psoroptes ovis TaxID=83912 RepID=A0A3B0R2J5_PSOOV|nr:double-stranded RNA-specific editase 1-like isoform X2 [Psoroptes ovis]